MIIIYSLISLVAYFLNKEYTFIKKQTLKKYFPMVLIIWLIFLVAFLIFNSPERGLEMFAIAFISFSIYNILFLLYLKMYVNRHFLFLFLFLPVSYFFITDLLLFNKPTYHGAMDGFANGVTAYLMLRIFISYPIFLFSFSMLNFSNLIKGGLIIIIALISGFLGVKQSIGIEGYLADGEGGIFACIIFILVVIGIGHLLKETKMKFINRT